MLSIWACASGDLAEDEDDAGGNSAGEASSSGGSSSGSGSSSSSGGSSSGSGSSGGSSSGGSSGGSSGASCPEVQCASARDYGEIMGEPVLLPDPSVQQALSISGTQSMWLRFKVKDDPSSELLGEGGQLSWRLRFTPAAGAQYELHLVNNHEGSCSTSTLQIPADQLSNYRTSWTDESGLLGFPKDDSRVVLLHVKQVGGDCPSATPWQLNITGGD